MRDMISAGIAIYDEFPEMYRAGRRPVLPRAPAGPQLALQRPRLPSRRFLRRAPLQLGHVPAVDLRPAGRGQRVQPGAAVRAVPVGLHDAAGRPAAARGRHVHDTARRGAGRGASSWARCFTASYYGDGTLLDQFLRQGGGGDNEAHLRVPLARRAASAQAARDLPLSRYFGPPFGWMVARTGWGEDAVIAEMKVNEYNFVNHQHLDAGAFQIYYQGALAIDSGLYSGSSGQYGSPHCQNYYWRTIAHNSLLVLRSAGGFRPTRLRQRRRPAPAQRPQRSPHARQCCWTRRKGYRTGQVLAHGFGPDPQTPDFTLLQGDLTAPTARKSSR